ncbi:permease [Acidithiobacillus caldus]
MDWLGTVLDYSKEFGEVAVFGFLFAGFLQAVARPTVVARYLSGYSLWRANAIGATVGFFTPLCCCTAIPTALALWRGGSRPGPACAFLIATPWFNWYGLVALWIFLGWQMALVVAGSGVLIAFLTGMIIDWQSTDRCTARSLATEVPEAVCTTTSCSVKSGSACCSTVDVVGSGKFFDFSHPWKKLQMAGTNAWALARELLPWIVAGILIGATVKTWLPTAWISALEARDWLTPVLALIFATLLYADSLGSLPLVNALLQKGLGPGNGMILLIAGVGSNIATLGPIYREMGARVAILYACCVMTLALLLGILWNLFL